MGIVLEEKEKFGLLSMDFNAMLMKQLGFRKIDLRKENHEKEGYITASSVCLSTAGICVFGAWL